jgi:transcriptional regulator with XRE-family HTH domain
MHLNLTNSDKSSMSKKATTEISLGQYLRGLRKSIGGTLHEVSKDADIDSPLISKIERSERLPTLDQLKRLANHYKVSEADLMVKLTAEKIVKEYGLNNTTYEAIRIVEEQFVEYSKSDMKIKYLKKSKS